MRSCYWDKKKQKTIGRNSVSLQAENVNDEDLETILNILRKSGMKINYCDGDWIEIIIKEDKDFGKNNINKTK